MVLIGVTISKLNISNLIDRNLIVPLSTLVIAVTFLTLLSLQTVPVYASVVEPLNKKVNWYDDALAVNQNNVPALVEKGTQLVATGNPQQALTWLDKALSIDEENIMGLISKGTALRELGNFQDAIILYERVLAIDPNDAYAIGGKADSLYMSGQHEQAIAWINKAVSLDPSDVKIRLVQESLIQAIN